MSVNSNGGSHQVPSASMACNHCKETSKVLKYVIPTADGKFEFCSEPCLMGYRKAKKQAQTNGDASPNNNNNNSTSTKSSNNHNNNHHHDTPSNAGGGDRDQEVSFCWKDYIIESGAIPAPATCFRQSIVPPSNEFKINDKVEALDPRSQSTCVATVVGCMGGRVRLRLDGSDTKNDFWLMVDSGDLNQIGTCEKNGGMLQPPIGYTLNAINWPKFLIKTLNGAVIATSKCFKKEPVKPRRNYFQKGQKLEAVDRKNPVLICPASVSEVEGDNIYVTFDGWKGAFDYWCRYDSRDIFPVGWCEISGHPLQHPGQKTYPGKAKVITNIVDSSSSSSSLISPMTINTSPKSNSVVGLPDSSHRNNSPSISTTSSASAAINGNIGHKMNSPSTVGQPTIKIFVNKKKIRGSSSLGPFLDMKKIEELPRIFGPGPINRVLRESVQNLVDCSMNQKEIFGLLRQGEGRVIILASFEDKMQTVRLPVIESEEAVWDFIEILFEELRCEIFYVKEEFKGEDTMNERLSEDEEKKNDVSSSSSSLNDDKKKQDKSVPSVSSPMQQVELLPLKDEIEEKESQQPLKRKQINNTEHDLVGKPFNPKSQKFDTATSTPNNTTLASDNKRPKSPSIATPVQPRPRGRPAGSKNKTPSSSRLSKPQNNSQQQSTPLQQNSSATKSSNSGQNASSSSPKRVPIYHNAHKIYQAQLSAANTDNPVTTGATHILHPSSIPIVTNHLAAVPNNETFYATAAQVNSNSSGVALPPAYTVVTAAPTTLLTPVTEMPPGTMFNITNNDDVPEDEEMTEDVKGFSHSPTLPPDEWSTEEVISRISQLDPTLGPHVELFRSHEIDGKALLLLTSDMMLKYMEMKLGPALKICNIIDMFQGRKHLPVPPP
ncbi:polycomb protein SCMH1 [Lepeophtheirus salmonis]|uniref:polycomb protein SCMH1 n=1 Tax=Lepeophtheirus salmonis TaxID=72036 RepID=UPI001AE16EE5|nr:sex comb on midleg-like protein 2 [Lepeophtheirus salmonis]XP_040576215.1 sex comb on midleg-like protein 2 [Lepeophtheirus salmonis]